MNVEYWDPRLQRYEVDTLEGALVRKLNQKTERYHVSPNEFIAGLAARLVEKGVLSLDEITEALSLDGMEVK